MQKNTDGAANFIFTLKGGFDDWKSKSEDERVSTLSKFSQWVRTLSNAGHYLECTRLQGTEKRVYSNGNNLRMDGPFPESKEVLSGIFYLKAPSIEELLPFAESCPVISRGGSVEIFRIGGALS